PPSQQAVVSLAAIPGGSFVNLSVYFCPNINDGQTYAGTVNVISNAASSPDIAAISAVEAHPIMVVSPTNLDVGSAAAGGNIVENTFEIRNDGSAPLNWGASETSDVDGVFSWTFTPGDETVAPGDAVTVTVRFTSAGAADTHSGEITVTATNLDVEGINPVTVALVAATTP
ncbi:MAG: DUF1573 domain-containing protein, partial [Thermoanaerobaculales bacterium]|nr:DUF1573 domain-containing protein [Thermoanaerobaculales bacterium]